MTSISEASGAQSQLAAALASGTATISQNQTLTFTQYTKFILPLDGYVFWVATGNTQTAHGSVHYTIDSQQNEDETISINTIIFTSESLITAFNSVSPTTIWIGTFEGMQFSFSSLGGTYEQAGLWHYMGAAVYPAMSAQLVSNSSQLLARQPVVSNSLPIWLAYNQFGLVYPSFLVPDNLAPPYIVAHVEPERTEALQEFPLLKWPGVLDAANASADLQKDGTALPLFTPVRNGVDTLRISGSTNPGAPVYTLDSTQLLRDKVRLTLYGFNNQQATAFYVSLIADSMDNDTFGFMNSPALRDEKRTQREISVIAQKKILDIDASYYLTTAGVIAQRMLMQASITTNAEIF